VHKLLDFDMVIESHDDGYRTRVVASPAGEAQSGFVLPFSDQDLRILILEVVGSIGRMRRRVRRIESQERQLLENFGGQLFEAVFSGPVGECLERSRMAAESKEAGLRVRLRLPGTLANVPWEYLYDAGHGFLGLDPETALVRYLELPAPVRPFQISPPLRILAMISAPSDTVGLEVEQEWDKLNDTLGDLVRRGLVKVDRLEAGNLAALQRPLRLTEYHVLHFIGHGGYDESAQDGALALEGADGKTRLVTGRDLGMMIRSRSLRLVVLNACEGARSAQDDPLGGVAQALVHQGIPAVIAMQFEISDTAAITFSQSFYQAIADGLPVDVATVEARRAMFAEGNEIEWATPVLYLRSTDGRVFTRGRASAAERQAKEEAARQAQLDAQRQAKEEAERQAKEQAARQAQLDAQRQAKEEAARQAQLDAERQAKLDAERQAKEQAARQAKLDAERQAQEEAERQAKEDERRGKLKPEPQARVPVLAASPIVLAVPLLILAVNLRTATIFISRPSALLIFWSAVLGCVVAAVECSRRRIPGWIVPTELIFAWFLLYAIYQLNFWHLRHLRHYLPVQGALAAIGAIFSASLWIWTLARSTRGRRDVHPLLPAFLGCMALGFGVAAIAYTGEHYANLTALHNNAGKVFAIASVLFFVALLVDLLSPFLELARSLQGRHASRPPTTPTMR
jgi:CHAT domain